MKRAFAALIGLAILAGTAPGTGAYSFNGPKWSLEQVPFYVNPVNNDLSESAAITAIQTAAAAWSLQTDADVQLYYAGRTTGGTLANNGKSEVFFRNETNGSYAGVTYYWYDGTGKIVDADMVLYDAGFRFFTGQSGCSSGIYLEDLATHEFGHFLGLSHSSNSVATMYPTMSAYCDQKWRTLDGDDIGGIEALYPPASTPSSPPAAPANLAARSSSGRIDLAWSDRSGDEDGFAVERSVNSGSFAQVAKLGANRSSYADQSVVAGSTYSYRVRAWNESGYSAYSNVASATPAADAPSQTLAAPTNPSPASGAIGVSTNVTLSWSAASGATSYDVYVGTGSNPPLYRANVLGTSVGLKRLSGGVTHYWRVVAKNSSGQASGPVWSFKTATKGSKGGGRNNGKGRK